MQNEKKSTPRTRITDEEINRIKLLIDQTPDKDITIVELAVRINRTKASTYNIVRKKIGYDLKWRRENFKAPRAKKAKVLCDHEERVPGVVYWGDSPDHTFFGSLGQQQTLSD